MQVIFDEMRADFSIGLRFKDDAFFRKLCFQLSEIFDDAVMNNKNPIGAVGMSVAFRWTAMGRPARVANPDRTLKGAFMKDLLQSGEFAWRPFATQYPRINNGDTRRIIAAIFQPP